MARKGPTNPRPRSTKARRRRGLLILCILLAVMLIPVMLTRTALVAAVILPGIGASIGADVSASRVVVQPDATIVADNVRIRLPDLSGAGAELFRADRVEIHTSWPAILSGSGEFKSMLLTRPRLTVSMDKDTGEINLGRLSPKAVSTGPIGAVPSIIVREGVIELGEDSPQGYEKLRELRVEGSVVPTPDPDRPGYAIAFTEGSVSDPQGRGLGLTGRVTRDGVTLTLRGLALAEWRPENVPTPYRDVFRLMGIAGTIPDTTMKIAADGSTEITATLDGVSLNLPFDSSGHAADPERLVRLKEVSGSIRVFDAGAEATLVGKLGDLPSDVHLTYEGLGAKSPFRCEIQTRGFEMSSRPEVLPLAPPIVVKRLADFSNPTATVDATMVVERAMLPDGTPGPIHVAGTLEFRDGTAAFHNFPYVFRDMKGLARFDDEKIEIVSVTGRSSSGAELHATGTIAPPLPGAAVELEIRVDNAPIDDAMLEAMGERRRGIVDALFSRERYAELVAAGLVHDPGQPGPGRAFALGGAASVEIHITRDLGEEAEYVESIRVRLPVAGIVPEPFPLPIMAHDVLIELDGHTATVVGGSFAGLSGGRAEVAATVDLHREDQHGVRMEIEASDVPTDDLLLAALPGGLDPLSKPRSPASILRRLGVQGRIDCSAKIAPREDDTLGYDVRVDFHDLAAGPAHPEGPAQPVRLEGLTGSLDISEQLLGLALDANVRPLADTAELGALSVLASLELGGESRHFTTSIAADLADVGPALEDLVATVAPDVAAKLAELRDQRRPEGGLKVRAEGAGTLGDEPSLTSLDVQVLECRDFSFLTEAGRMRVTSQAGSLRLSALAPDAVQFDAFAADITVGDAPLTGVELSGVYPLGRDWKQDDHLSLRVHDAHFESAMVRRAGERTLPSSLAATMERASVAGVFDADLDLRGSRPIVTGEIRPRSCEFTIKGERVAMTSMHGGIRFEETGGSFTGCRAEGAGWWAEVSGDWAGAGEGAVIVNATIDGRSEAGLTPELRAVLPGSLRDALTGVSVEAAGPLAVDKLSLRVSLDEAHGAAYRSSGRVAFAGASAELGVKITDCAGYLDFEAESVPGRRMGNFGIGLIFDSATAGGIHLGHSIARIAGDPLSGDVLAPVILGDAYGGRVSGSVLVSERADGKHEYHADFKLSGVPLGELLADWEHAVGVEHAAAYDEVAPERASAESRGMVDVGVSFTGLIGDPSQRRGRGSIQVGGGDRAEVLRLPLLLPLIQVSNLQIPQNDRLDFAEAVFFVEGEDVVFERIGVFAESVELFGYGRMTLPGLDLDLRFNSRAVNRLPLISDLMEKFRNELITTRVAGTVREPQVSLMQFARTRQMLAAALGKEPSEEERRILEIERLSRESVLRDRRAARHAGSPAAPGGYAPGPP